MNKIIKMKSETKRALSNSESEKRDLYTKYSNHEYTKKNSELDKKIEELKAKINNDIENLAKKFFDIAKRYGYYKHQDIPRNYM